MSCKNKCRNHFKGVENFLRRVAFNLGNTPSQTEVKIISCIPIDVTDLQQKIVSLEKELEDVRGKPAECLTAPVTTAQAPLHQAAVFSVCSPACGPSTPPRSLCDSYTRVQDLFATTSTAVPICTCWSDDPNDATSLRADLAACESNYKKSVFKKLKKRRDKLKKKDKNKPQLVYYAQTSNNPFNRYGNRPVHSNSPATDDTMSRAYISDMIRKQYTPVPIIQDYSIMSEFSSPICRDVERGCAGPPESDACSCCRGARDADHQRAAPPDALRTPPARPAAPYGSNTDFYDTTLYDMIPVRERPIRTTKVHDKSTRRSPKSNHSERSRSRTKMHYVINHHGRVPVTSRLNSRKTPARMVNIKISPKRKFVSEREPTETSNSCCFDCGNVYVKRVLANSKPPAAPKPPVTTSHKNVECLTHALNDSECQTTTTQSVQIDQELLEEKKTEATLNQIKTILQTVLTEVKTNAQLKQVAEDKCKKDAVVQKGASQGNMPGCSSLLHSYTYSPYNMNPYLASCSRQMTSGQCCFPNMPYTSGKCMQNFPVFIQTPGRHMCSSCYRNSSHIPKVGQQVAAKQANTMATNTDSKERSKETEKLIKEIYKSMTVNMDFAGKDTSLSECNQMKYTRQGSANKPVYRPAALHDSVRKFVKVIESRNVQQSTQPITALNSKLMSSNTMSMRSQIVSTTDTERRLRNKRLENYLKAVESQKRQKRIEEEREYEEASLESSASEEEPTSSSDTEGRVVYTRVQDPTEKTETAQKTEPNRKGLLRKMLKSVKLFHTKTKKKEEQIQVANEEDEESEGDSEDYQTVYSQREERAPRAPGPARAVRSPARLRAHSKISYSRHMRDRNQERCRKPYMEQEYRRHWNERFHEHRHRYSSEGQYSSSTATRPVYWQNYEARSALVKPTSPTIDTQPVRDTSPGAHEDDTAPNKETTAKKGLAWLKKHRLGIHCGPQWKKFILEG